jgi:hypothetical protein
MYSGDKLVTAGADKLVKVYKISGAEVQDEESEEEQ